MTAILPITNSKPTPSPPPFRRLFVRVLEEIAFESKILDTFLMMILFICVLGVLVISPQFLQVYGAQEFKGYDLRRDPPTRLLSNLIEHCRKTDCGDRVQSAAIFLDDMVKLLVDLDEKVDPGFLATLEMFAMDLQHCKDAACLIDFEAENGQVFAVTLSKALNLIRESPERADEVVMRGYQFAEIFG